MPVALKLSLSALIGYVMGSINPAYIISRIKGTDIRKEGSYNAGASNVVIVFGAALGVFTALFDIAKSYFAIKIAEHFFDDAALHISGCVAGAMCIIGHIFPLFMNFRGGKGLSCLGGVYLALGLKPFIVCLTAELVIALCTNYICFVSISGAIAFPVILFILTGNWIGALVYVLPSVFVLLKHRLNIKRIINGVEARISGLWNRGREEERVDRYKELIDYHD